MKSDTIAFKKDETAVTGGVMHPVSKAYQVYQVFVSEWKPGYGVASIVAISGDAEPFGKDHIIVEGTPEDAMQRAIDLLSEKHPEHTLVP